MHSPQLRSCRVQLGLQRGAVQQKDAYRRAQRTAGFHITVIVIPTNLAAVRIIGRACENGLRLLRDQRGQNNSHRVAERPWPLGYDLSGRLSGLRSAVSQVHAPYDAGFSAVTGNLRWK